MTLRDLRPGDRARIVDCGGRGAIFQRLGEMGLVAGAELRLVRRAPFGGPIQIEVMSSHLALRRREAGFILVERLPG